MSYWLNFLNFMSPRPNLLNGLVNEVPRVLGDNGEVNRARYRRWEERTPDLPLGGNSEMTQERKAAAEATLARFSKLEKKTEKKVLPKVLRTPKTDLDGLEKWTDVERVDEASLENTDMTEERNSAANATLARVQDNQMKMNKKVDRMSKVWLNEPGPSTSQVKQEDCLKTVEDASDSSSNARLYFRCPEINDQVLTRQEWNKVIKEYIKAEMKDNPIEAACRIIWSCNSSFQKIATCIETICKYLTNITENPNELKYRKIRMSNKAFEERVWSMEGSMEFLVAVGFGIVMLPGTDGVEEDYLFFNDINATPLHFSSYAAALVSNESNIQLELHRDPQVIQNGGSHLEFPEEFYELAPEDLKREKQLKTEIADKELQTKAKRELEEIKKKRVYKYAVIRIRFPDGVILQGTFSKDELYVDIHAFVLENLVEEELPFTLTTSSGMVLSLEKDAHMTIEDLDFLPTVTLSFAWDGATTTEYLKKDEPPKES